MRNDEKGRKGKLEGRIEERGRVERKKGREGMVRASKRVMSVTRKGNAELPRLHPRHNHPTTVPVTTLLSWTIFHPCLFNPHCRSFDFHHPIAGSPLPRPYPRVSTKLSLKVPQ